jgi:hypothetical protein
LVDPRPDRRPKADRFHRLILAGPDSPTPTSQPGIRDLCVFAP